MGKLEQEFPRYEYQHLIWKVSGVTDVSLDIQIEIMKQWATNVSVLAMPAFVMAQNKSEHISPIEIAGVALTVVCWLSENKADGQKRAWIKEMFKTKQVNKVCDVGLWSYCRHPNYFFEWMVWNGLIFASIPSLIKLHYHASESKCPHCPGQMLFFTFVFGLIYASRMIYVFLVY